MLIDLFSKKEISFERRNSRFVRKDSSLQLVEYKLADGKNIRCVVRVVGTGKTFEKSLDDIFGDLSWLQKFSVIDIVSIACKASKPIQKNQEIEPELRQYKWLNNVSMIYVSFLILANLAAGKLIPFFSHSVTAGIIFYPFIYIFDDLITEVYGYKVNRRLTWGISLVNLIFWIGLYAVVLLPPYSGWKNQESFETTFNLSPKIFIVSSLVFIAGDFVDSYLLARLKILTNGHFLAARILCSGVCGIFIESTLFCALLFLGILPLQQIVHMIGAQCMIKLGFEIVLLPVTCKTAQYLKNAEKCDHFDHKTNFNPFSLKLKD